MLADLQELMTYLVFMTTYSAGEARAMALVGNVPPREGGHEIMDPQATADDMGLDISQWPITKGFDQLYDFAVHGIARFPLHQLGNETDFTYFAALVEDLAGSVLVDEIAGGSRRDGTKCLLMAKLAAARGVLEGGERFLLSRGSDGSDESHDSLTIRDVALLAGMEEMSVRNAANPKLPNPLVTTKDGNSTYITPANAKAWLESRGRYIPIRHQVDDVELDLTRKGFAFPLEAWSFFEARAEARGNSWEKICEIVNAPAFNQYGSPEGLALDMPTTTRLAEALELDPRLLYLRLREVCAGEESRRVRKEIEAATSGAPGKK